MLKKIAIGFTIFLVVALIMDLIVKKATLNDPPITRLAVDSIYLSTEITQKLGVFEASGVKVDSVSSDLNEYFFTIGILGNLKDSVFTGTIVRSGGKWKLVELKGLPPAQ